MATLSGSSGGIAYYQLKERTVKQETCEEGNRLPVSANQSNSNSDISTVNGLVASNVPIVSSLDSTQFGMLNQLEPSITAEEEELQESPEIDIVINNVVCNFNVRCHLNLRQIALTGSNVEYRRENGMLTMKLRNPGSTASIWSSGKVTCTGATSEDAAKKAARKIARILQKLGFRIRFTNFRIVNVLGTCTMPFKINIVKFSRENRNNAVYEPELHPGVTYKIKDIKATMKIFSTGSITITAPSVANVQSAVEHIFPLVYEFRKESFVEDVDVSADVCIRNTKAHCNKSSRTKEQYIISEDDDEIDDFCDSSD